MALVRRAVSLAATVMTVASLSACSADAKLFVYAPSTGGVTVFVDGKKAEAVRAGAFAIVDVDKGQHSVEVRSDADTVAATITPKVGDRLFVRAPNTCYVAFDATALYGATDDGASVVESLPIVLRVVDDDVVPAPPNLAFGGFPTKFNGEGALHVMYEAPCGLLARDDEAVFAGLAPLLEKGVKRAINARN